MRLLLLFALCVISFSGAAQAFTLKSADIKDGQKIGAKFVFNGFGCTGENVSPALSWTDAPTGSGWWHWVMYNIPANSDGLPQGAGSGGTTIPNEIIHARNDYGVQGYGGPCPPPGAPHRYIVTVYALSAEKLDIPADASPAMVGFMLGTHTLAKASLTAPYSR
jgi:Raf kinase inhibitor-like YbhB/YbcL family protein